MIDPTDLDEWTARHVADALATHRLRLTALGSPGPIGTLVEIEELYRAIASGQRRTDDGDRHHTCHADPMLTYTQAAQLLLISVRTVRRWVQAGSLPVVRHGGSPRIRRADLTRPRRAMPAGGPRAPDDRSQP